MSQPEDDPSAVGPRVRRGPPPLLPIRKKKYRQALPELRRDFGDRCAYCMRRILMESDMQVDHFDPRQKGNTFQAYTNLYLSDAGCNNTKSNNWPTPDNQASGVRFLDCCKERDYGESIFEDPVTHFLVGTTPAAIYHILTIGLNRRELVDARRSRAEARLVFEKLRAAAAGDEVVDEALAKIEPLLSDIPDIPPPPPGFHPTVL